MDTKFNYFKDVNNNLWGDNFNLKDRKDPDELSERLYKDLSTLYLNKRMLPNGNTIEFYEDSKLVEIARNGSIIKYYEARANIIEGKDVLYSVGLGSDYIGPSINWASKAKVSEKDIMGYIEVSRTIGGHILFPRWIRDNINNVFYHSLSINKAKGGEKGFYDRIDLTLYDINEWYKWYNAEKSTCDSKLKLTYDKNQIWLKQFVDFPNFIEYFSLMDFVNENKSLIKDLTSYNSYDKSYSYLKGNNSNIPTGEQEYLNYAEGVDNLIKLRNEKLQ